MALWKTRSPGSDQKSDTDEDKPDTFQDQQEEDERLSCEEDASHLVIEDARMSKIYSEELPLNVSTCKKHQLCK